MIKNIIFDIGRVLNGYGWEEYLHRVVPGQEAYKAVEQAIFLNPAWVEHDKGFLTEKRKSRILCRLRLLTKRKSVQYTRTWGNVPGHWTTPFPG